MDISRYILCGFALFSDRCWDLLVFSFFNTSLSFMACQSQAVRATFNIIDYEYNTICIGCIIHT